MGSSLKRRQPRRGQLALLSNDEHDVLTLDEATKTIGKHGVAEARKMLIIARRKEHAR